ncbi:sensor histidine kinase [bacterium SCSIO 12643]|nr:sensor histidine kinase [bacterium SCSIO 12643]
MNTRNLIVFVFTFFFITNTYSQETTFSLSDIEDSILLEKFDVAQKMIQGNDTSEYMQVLNRISKQNASNLDYVKYIAKMQNKVNSNFDGIVAFIDRNVTVPQNDSVDYNYVKLIWVKLTTLTNTNKLEQANTEHQKLEQYIAQFDPNQRNTKRAQILASTYPITLYIIQENIEEGKKLCLENQKTATEIKDTNLIINSLYYLSEFLIFERNLDEYIRVSEYAYELDQLQYEKSAFYIGNMMHLADAYIFKGVSGSKILPLLNELYQIPNSRLGTYSYFIKYLGTIEIPSPESDSIFNAFQSENLIQFCEHAAQQSEGKLDNVEFYHLLNEISNTLARFGHYQAALDFKDQCIYITKQNYSQDLSKSLAQYETNLLKQKQELELENEKQKTEMYFVITLLVGVLFAIAIIAIVMMRKKERLLKTKNEEITRQRDDIQKKEEEKATLLKEIHHRVKNNFQVISSLLELQSSGIEDKKALELAQEGKNRINSMALIHKKLYENDDLIMFFDEYLVKLVNDLTEMYGKKDQLKIQTDIPHIAFDIDTAIPLGLIVNELVTNALKYGTGNNTPELSVSIEKDQNETYTLHVQDNGAGIPDHLNIKQLRSLGLQLVQGLSKQLQGSFEFINQNGAHFIVTFKDTYTRSLTD